MPTAARLSLQRRPPVACLASSGRRMRSQMDTSQPGAARRQLPAATPPAACRLQQRGVAAAAAAAAVSDGPSDVLVLDFDGVICDSEKEVSISAFEASEKHWPQLFGSLGHSERGRVLAGLRAARPRLVKGYEAMAMARLVLEDDSNVQRILATWEAGLLPASLAAWGEREAALAAAFEQHRAARMRGDANGWLALNPLYEGVAEALRECPYPYYIASSKAANRLVSLLRASSLNLDVDEQSPRLFASLLPPNEKKIAALREVMQRPVAAGGARLHFVDDRFETLHAIVEQAPDIAARYQLCLASWGYCTAEEQAAAVQLPGVRLLTLPQFRELLRWGVVMEVDDGCEPTREEVEEGVRW